LAVAADVPDAGAMEAMVRSAEVELGRVELLVNNGGAATALAT
jgi:NADP-dependent 3-hydroxy acid dehydrogenase YdfG